MARNDLELAKSLMTAEQLQQWAELRSRNEVADYGDSVSVLFNYSGTPAKGRRRPLFCRSL